MTLKRLHRNEFVGRFLVRVVPKRFILSRENKTCEDVSGTPCTDDSMAGSRKKDQGVTRQVALTHWSPGFGQGPLNC